jgi:hypothetical protein
MLSQKVRARKANVKSSTLLKTKKRKRKMKNKKTEHFRQNEEHSSGGKKSQGWSMDKKE